MMSSSVIFASFLILCSTVGYFYPAFAFSSDDLKCGISYFNDTEQGHHRIYHGDKAALGQFPWMAAILKGGNQDCSGTIISEEYMLTAGHCTAKVDVIKDLKVIVGSLTTAEHDTKLDIVAYSQHPGFNCTGFPPTCRNDIAVLKLAKPLQFSNNVQPICLAASFDGDSSSEPEDESVLAAGWGWKLPNRTQTDTLLYGHMHFVDIETCASKHDNWEISQGLHICADGKHQHTDHGDSGGPIFIKSELTETETGRHRYVEVGITSFEFDPDVFTRVSSYCEFISKSTEGKVKCVNL